MSSFCLLHIRQSSSSLPSSHSIWPLHLNRASMHRPSRQVNSSSRHARKSPTHNSHQHNKQSQTWSTINHDVCSWWRHYYEAPRMTIMSVIMITETSPWWQPWIFAFIFDIWFSSSAHKLSSQHWMEMQSVCLYYSYLYFLVLHVISRQN